MNLPSRPRKKDTLGDLGRKGTTKRTMEIPHRALGTLIAPISERASRTDLKMVVQNGSRGSPPVERRSRKGGQRLRAMNATFMLLLLGIQNTQNQQERTEDQLCSERGNGQNQPWAEQQEAQKMS